MIKEDISCNVNLMKFTRQELRLVISVCNEVLHGFKLNNNERLILRNVEFGIIFEKKMHEIIEEKNNNYDIELTLDELAFLRNAIIVVMIRLNKHDLYFTHMGFQLADCLNLLDRIINESN